MTDCYLREHPPRRRQFRDGRRAKPTGLTVLHTAENITDFAGPSQSAESVARFIRNRDTPGSYHDLVDADSCIHLVRYEDEAYHDGTGSNPYGLSISWAIAAADWAKLSSARRAALLDQGAQAFARQQRWLRAHRLPTTPLRIVTKADSDRGLAGFIGHGMRDPARRSDPGRDFPWRDWFAACAAANSPPPPPPKGPSVFIVDDPASTAPENDRKWLCDANTRRHIGWHEYLGLLRAGVLELDESAPVDERAALLLNRKDVA